MLAMFWGLGNEVAIWCLRVILIGQLVNVVTGPVGSALVMLGGARQLIRVSWTVLAVMVVSTAILAPWQGVIGVCIAAAFSLALRNVMNRSEEHTSELQSLMRISYAVFCLKKKRNK